MTFKAWKNKVDELLINKYGVSSDDLADAPYWAEWDAGTTPREMVEIVEEYNDFY